MSSTPAVASRAAAASSSYLLIDARVRLDDATSALSTAAAAVWRQLLPFVHCQALLAATVPHRSDWSVVAIVDEGGDTANAVEWLVRQPVSVGSLRELRQRCRRPLSAAQPTQPPPLQDTLALQQQRSADVASAVDPILVALKEIMQHQQQRQCEPPLPQQQRHSPHTAPPELARSAVLPCHIVLLSPHLYSPHFVREPDRFVHSLSTMGGAQYGFSFRLLHLRCHDQRLSELHSPLLTSLQGAPYIRSSLRADCVTSSALQQPQQVWSVPASLSAVEPVHATLLVGAPSSTPPLSAMPSMSDSGSEQDDETWQEAFDDQWDCGADGLEAAGEGGCVLTIPVMLLPAVRTLPLPANTQVSQQHEAFRASGMNSSGGLVEPCAGSVVVSLTPVSCIFSAARSCVSRMAVMRHCCHSPHTAGPVR